MIADSRADRPVPDRPLLRGERVWLRPLEERDLPAYVAGINDTEVGGLAGYKAPMSVEQADGLAGARATTSGRRATASSSPSASLATTASSAPPGSRR